MESDDRARRLANVLVAGMNAKALISGYRTDGKGIDGATLRQVLMDLALKLQALEKDDFPNIHGMSWPDEMIEKVKRLHDALVGVDLSAPFDDRLIVLAVDCCGFLDIP